MDRKTFDISKIIILSMDEADVLLDKEFVGQTRDVIKKINHDTHYVYFMNLVV